MKTLCMKTVFDVLITIRDTSIMHISLLQKKEKRAKIITNKEDTGLQSIIDKTYLKIFLHSPFIKEGAVEISQKMSLQTLMKKNLTGSEHLVLANMVCSFQSSNHYS